MSSIESPVFSNAFSVAGTGPEPNIFQCTPATALPSIVALIFNPFSFANLSLVISIAEAPIEKGLLVAAVTVPSALKAGFKDLIFSLSGVLGPLSLSITVPSSRVIGTISLSNFPASRAATALS